MKSRCGHQSEIRSNDFDDLLTWQSITKNKVKIKIKVKTNE